MKKGIIALLVVQLAGLSSVWACLTDFTADIQFGSKQGEVSILLSDTVSSKKRAIYNYKKDKDGAIGLVALTLASKNTDKKKLQSLKKPLQLSLTKFINYWSEKPSKEIPKSVQTAIFKARKLLAKIKEDQLSENDFAFLSEEILIPFNKEKSLIKREHELLVYDKKGVIDRDAAMIGTGKTLSTQVPAGLFQSAVNREVDRGGLDFLAQEEEGESVKTCSNEEGLKTYAGQIIVAKPIRGNRLPILKPPSQARTGFGTF